MKKAISSDYFLFAQKALQCDSCDSCDSFQRLPPPSLSLEVNYYIYNIYNNLNIYTYNLIAANSQYTPSAENCHNCHNCHAVTPFALSLLCISYSTKFRYL